MTKSNHCFLWIILSAIVGVFSNTILFADSKVTITRRFLESRPISRVRDDPATHTRYIPTDIPAVVVSLDDSYISAEVSAVIKEIHVQVGDTVNEGDLLISLDPWQYEAELQTHILTLNQINVQIEYAQTEFKRYSNLKKKNVVSISNFDKVKSQLNVLRAQKKTQEQQIKTTRIKIEKCQIRARFSGIITDRKAQIGSYVMPGSQIIRLTDTENLELSVKINHVDSQILDPNKEYTFLHVTGGIEHARYTVHLRKLLPVLSRDQQHRFQEARFTFVDQTIPMPNARGRFLLREETAGQNQMSN